MVSFKLNERQVIEVVNKITGQWAFLIQKELISRFPFSFANRIVVSREGTSWIIGSNFNILKFYDRGTRPHVIEPKVKNALAFNWPKAPSIPGQPGKNGNFVFKKVIHPGTKGFHIIENLEKDKKLLQNLLNRAVKNVLK